MSQPPADWVETVQQGDREIVVHRVHLHLDGRGFVSEREAAVYLRCSVKTVQRMRREEYFGSDECRCIRGSWRYSLQALDRYHDDQCAPAKW